MLQPKEKWIFIKTLQTPLNVVGVAGLFHDPFKGLSNHKKTSLQSVLIVIQSFTKTYF